jgi:protein O-mannosyl-transferase
VMVTAPVIVLLFERTLVTGSFREALRRSWPLYLGLALGWVLLAGLNYNSPRSESAGFHLPLSPVTWWFTQAKVLWMYLKLVVWPWPLLIHYQLPYLETFGQAWPWLLATTLLGIAVLFLLWRRRAAGLVGAWVLLILSPTLVVPIVTEVAAERRMYLPLAAIVALVVCGGYWLLQQVGSKISTARVDAPTSRRATMAVIGLAATMLAVVCSVVDVRRLDAFHDPITLWQDLVDHQPDDSIAHNNLGGQLLYVGRVREAIPALETALQIDPKHTGARINLGTALMRMGRTKDAISQFQQVVALHPDFVPGRCNLGIALGKVGRPQEAIEQFQSALKLDRNNAAVHYNLGLLVARTGQLPEAIEHFRAALESDPKYFEAHFNLGTALAMSGKTKEAVGEFEEALKIKPDDCGVYFNLALAYDQMDQGTDSMAAAQKALVLARSQGQAVMAQRIQAWLQGHEASPEKPGGGQ